MNRYIVTALKWIPQDLTYVFFKIGSGNGLVPSGNKPLPKTTAAPISMTWYGITRPQWVNTIPLPQYAEQ